MCVERAEAEAIYDAGREVVVEVLLRMDRRIQQLEARVEKLERELSKSSRNSSLPPSADPPGVAAATRQGPLGRARGAQPGHEGHGRELLPACGGGRGHRALARALWMRPRLRADELLGVGEPVRHQVEELPVIAARVIEHRCPAGALPRLRRAHACAGCPQRYRQQRVRSALSSGRGGALGAQPRQPP